MLVALTADMIAEYSLTAFVAYAGLTYAGAMGQSSSAVPPPAPFQETTVRVEKNQRMLEVTVRGDPDRNGDSAMRAWVAVYGLPISETFPEPPSRAAVARIWKYGLVAETSYSGAYAGARPALESLKAYVENRGFTFFGEMEEVYVRGRGTLDQGNPAGYLTLIRFRVRGAGEFPLPTLPLSSNP